MTGATSILCVNVLPFHSTSHVKSLFPLSYRVSVISVDPVTCQVLPSTFCCDDTPMLRSCCVLFFNLIDDMLFGRILVMTQYRVYCSWDPSWKVAFCCCPSMYTDISFGGTTIQNVWDRNQSDDQLQWQWISFIKLWYSLNNTYKTSSDYVSNWWNWWGIIQFSHYFLNRNHLYMFIVTKIYFIWTLVYILKSFIRYILYVSCYNEK